MSSRSTATPTMSVAAASLRARCKRSSTRSWSPTVSLSTLRSVAVMSACSGWARSTSSSVRILVRGLRSSCEASATNRCWRRTASSTRASVSFIVRASRSISSPVRGSGIRPPRLVSVISAICARIRSTGRRTRPISHHVSAPSSRTTAGTLVARTRETIRNGSVMSSRLIPTTRYAGRPPLSTVRVSTRNDSLRPGTESVDR